MNTELSIPIDNLETIILKINSGFKQRLLEDGKEGQVWLAADALATSMQELYKTAYERAIDTN